VPVTVAENFELAERLYAALELAVPPGKYLVTAGEVEGLLGQPATVEVSISAGETTSVTLEYDTGIR
jgi:hypothetical protein